VKQELEKIEKEALEAIRVVSDLAGVRTLNARYLGRKGIVTGLLRKISGLPPEERPETGKLANEIKKRIEEALEKAVQAFEGSRDEAVAEALDVTLPGRPLAGGRMHHAEIVFPEHPQIHPGPIPFLLAALHKILIVPVHQCCQGLGATQLFHRALDPGGNFGQCSTIKVPFIAETTALFRN